jgi:flagellar biosynthetic protein FliQ
MAMALDPTLLATMSDGDVMTIAGKAVWTTMLVAGPVLLVGLVVGLVVSIFQAVTQIQEQTLVFIPKLIAIIAVLALTGPWMLNVMLTFTTDLFAQIPAVTASSDR